MTWLYQHHDYGDIEGFDNIEDVGNSGYTEAPVTDERIKEYITNTKWLFIYYAIFLGFILFGGPWIFYYCLLVSNNYFPICLNYKTTIVEESNDSAGDKPYIILAKTNFQKAAQMSSTTKNPAESINLNECFLPLGSEKKLKFNLNYSSYFNLPVPKFGDNMIANDSKTTNWFYRFYSGNYLYTLLWYFNVTYNISLPFVVFLVIILSLVATLSLMSNYSTISALKHYAFVSGGSLCFLIITVLAVAAGIYSSSSPLTRVNPDNDLDSPSLPVSTNVFILNFMQTFNSEKQWGSWFAVVFSYFWRAGGAFLCFMLTLLSSSVISIFSMITILYFMVRRSGIYYIKEKEYTLNILSAHKIFYRYFFTFPFTVEIICLIFIMLAFIVERDNAVYNGFGIIVLLGTLIFWGILYFTGTIKNTKAIFANHAHTDVTETKVEPSESSENQPK